MSSNFVRFQKILNQAYAENFSCLSKKSPSTIQLWTQLNKSFSFPLNNFSGPVDGYKLNKDGERILSLFLYGPLIALIIGACVLGFCFCCCFVYCIWGCCRLSEDYEKTQVVPISIIETY